MPSRNFKDDEQALLRLAAGDLAAYRFLFDRHFADLCNYLNIYLHSKEFSEAVALEIFEYVWEKRESLVIRVSFRSFLFVSAKNKAISHYRKEHREKYSSFDLSETIVYDETTSQHFLEEKELRAVIEAAISKLPEQSRKIYLMAREENLSHKEIAGLLGLTPKTVENHVGIALRKLRETLNPFYRQLFTGWMLHFLFT
jgi:RNA polymerase sigma-70 factor (ECF subfamily)